jgi:hypothetical protein
MLWSPFFPEGVHMPRMMLAIALLLSGCASIMNGANQKVHLDSVPPGAQVTIFAIEKSTGQPESAGAPRPTPTTVELSRSKVYRLLFKGDGFPEREITLGQSVSGWVWGNLLFGGIGFLVDMGTGGMFKLVPEPAVIDMASGKMPRDARLDAPGVTAATPR